MTVGFIGAGNMATAIISGVIKSGVLLASEIGVYDVNTQKVDDYIEKGLKGYSDPTSLVKECKYIVLAVKPQNCPEVLELIGNHLDSDSVIISIAAGISAEYIKTKAGFDVKVISVMPNTPLLIGCGSTAISYSSPTEKQEFNFAKSLFESAGNVEEIPNELMNEVIPLNGSSPAFIYLFTKLFVDRAIELGFDKDTANRLFCHTLIGSAKMMLETGKSHQELIDMVSSPGGTTLKGTEALVNSGIEKAIKNCFNETVKRAYELGK